jgi:hypothetical protein
MDEEPEPHREVTRVPTDADLVSLARELNRLKVAYVVVGGFAINRLGFVRATEDIDLLIARDRANQALVKQALEILPDRAIRELGEEDISQWVVVRVNDDITVDLMTEACGVRYEDAKEGIEIEVIDGVPVPFAGAELMLKMKQSVREKDATAPKLHPAAHSRPQRKADMTVGLIPSQHFRAPAVFKGMKFARPFVVVGVLFTLALAAAGPTEADVPLKFSRLDLTDGRKLKDVVVKSYDAKTEKLLVIADGKAMTIPIGVVPAPFNQQLKGAPASGGSVSTFGAPSSTLVSASDQYRMDVPATVRPMATVPPQSAPPRARPAPDPAAVEAARLKRHQSVARTRAERYYRYEHPLGSSSIKVMAIEFELSVPKAVPGYTGRVETQGKVYLDYIDTVGGGSVQRATAMFEIMTEETPADGINVIDFRRKS